MKTKNSIADCSLIVSTYNWPEALTCCLNSIAAQTVLPTEIIIADDGSTEETKNATVDWSKRTHIPLIHVWHADQGFRLSEIRNKAIQRAAHPYIIQIDGDIILDSNFIEDHLKSAV